MKILRILFAALIALAALPSFGQSPGPSILGPMIISSTCSVSATTNAVIPLVFPPAITGTNFIIDSANILVTGTSAVTKAPVLTIISGTNTGLDLTGTGTLLTATTGYITHLAFVNPAPVLTNTTPSLYIATTGSATTLSITVSLWGYPIIYP
jgi:hypothetical protein